MPELFLFIVKPLIKIHMKTFTTFNNFINDYMVSPSAAIDKGRRAAAKKAWTPEPTDDQLNSPGFQMFVAKVVKDALDNYRGSSTDHVA